VHSSPPAPGHAGSGNSADTSAEWAVKAASLPVGDGRVRLLWQHPDGREWMAVGDWSEPPALHPLTQDGYRSGERRTSGRHTPGPWIGLTAETATAPERPGMDAPYQGRNENDEGSSLGEGQDGMARITARPRPTPVSSPPRLIRSSCFAELAFALVDSTVPPNASQKPLRLRLTRF
jgi:hypothetical protein